MRESTRRNWTTTSPAGTLPAGGENNFSKQKDHEGKILLHDLIFYKKLLDVFFSNLLAQPDSHERSNVGYDKAWDPGFLAAVKVGGHPRCLRDGFVIEDACAGTDKGVERVQNGGRDDPLDQLESYRAFLQVEEAGKPVTPGIVRDEQTEEKDDQVDFRGQFKQVNPVERQVVQEDDEDCHHQAHEHGQYRSQNGAKVAFVEHGSTPSLFFLLVVRCPADRVASWVFLISRVSGDPAEGEDVSQGVPAQTVAGVQAARVFTS